MHYARGGRGWRPLLLQPGHGEDEIEVEGGAPAGGDVGVLANARGVLGEGGIAHLMAGVLDTQVAAYPFVPLIGRRAAKRRHPEDRFGRLVAKPILGVASAHRTLQPVLTKVLRHGKHPVGSLWRVDEMYLKVAGQ